MEILLLLAAVAAFDVLLVTLILIAWHVLGEAEAEDTAFAERRLPASFQIDSIRMEDSFFARSSHSRLLIAAQSRSTTRP